MASRGRGRPRKPRETRMDAAVDAMKDFGFEEKLIKSTVKELLKVYGGSDAWPLIEDGHYATLLDLLLKTNEGKECGNEASTSKNVEGASQLDQPEQTMALEQNPDATEAGTAEPLNDAEPPFSDITDNASGNDYTGMEDSRGADVNLNVPAINTDSNPDMTNSIDPLTILPPQPPIGTIPNPRRKPCYGWLSDEDEDSDGVVYVPAKLPEKTKPKRKVRWDVRPDDID
ncbi:uncharacterized protein LOC141677347 [Apium graveolens]|uniref:uncharacterized protein LOC141677347 n=1 Tax=Apium graveolens TaxID=4045 RepID=UPI003D7B3AC6